MYNRSRIGTSWVLPTLLILFILQAVTLPFVIKYTYSGRSESPDHTITYSTQKLKWDGDTVISKDGSAKLSLFDTYYENVKSNNDSNILAPGTTGDNIIRLKNSTNRDVKYTAVVYEIKNQEALDVDVEVNGNNFTDTNKYVVPSTIKDPKVIRAIKGSLKGGRIQDFDIDWKWGFETGQDDVDTMLGNKSFNNSTQDIIIGFYITVEDEGEIVPPQTGDNTILSVYVLLMVGSGIALIISFITRKKEREDCDE